MSVQPASASRSVENVSFNHDGRTYTAYGWYDEAQNRYFINSVLVIFQRKNGYGGTNRQSRYVFRGLAGSTKLQRRLVMIASSMMFDRRFAEAI